jgi:hypothetical protein
MKQEMTIESKKEKRRNGREDYRTKTDRKLEEYREKKEGLNDISRMLLKKSLLI